jgi:glutathione peroxidase
MIYNIEVENQDGTKEKLEKYKGKVLLIVNTATKCGFTKQYTELEELHEKYNDRGFEILDFPCNQFFMQAPETDEEINKICSLKYNTKFKRYHKIDVNGKNATELYTYLKNNYINKERSVRIKWNFTKFLVNKKGEVVGRYQPKTTPKEIERDIERLLNE